MFNKKGKYSSLGLVICLASLLLCCKGCTFMNGPAKEEQTAKEQQLRVLEEERTVLSEQMQMQREALRRFAQEYGTTSLVSRQDMMLQRVASLLAELTKIEANRIRLEAEIEVLERKEAKKVEELQKLTDTRYELERAKVYEKRMRETLAKEDTEAIELGRKQLTIEELKEQLELTQERYDTVCQRIHELELE